ncbi:MAG TPA: ATP-dependent DNA helicase RecG [Chloroflexota bacterium]|nr:ATP-dependent DNA helicase RecG [Chloroflexota bacterium]
MPPPAKASVGPPADPLDSPIQLLKGVGPANAAKYQKLGIQTVRDVLYHFPRRYLDYRAAKLVKDLSGENFETILATIWDVKADHRPGGLYIIRATLADESGNAEAIWFRRNDYLVRDLIAGRTIVVSGECRFVGGRPQFKDPEWENYVREDTVHTARLVPVYPLSEGVTARSIRVLAKQAVDKYANQLIDHLPGGLRNEFRLLDLTQAVAQVHFPDTDDLLKSARRRLAFDELLVLQLGVLARRRAWDLGDPGPSLQAGEARADAFLSALPFTLTEAQAEALEAVRGRIRGTVPMSLLLQGDVGSGKTVVATAAMIQAAASGYQAAIMAPTEILAEQHYQTLGKLLSGLGEAAPRVTLLTGSVKGGERRARLGAIQEGEVDLVVGTQALVQEGVAFARLGLVVVDEQHRFGVAQRSTLRQKGFNPHVLVMTATPIPRTLALTLYGDLDLAVIGTLPPGRQRVKTRFLQPTDRPKAYAFLRKEVAEGHQAFVVYPLVEESEKSEARAAVAEYDRLRNDVFSDGTVRLGLLHGRMKPAEKEEVMRQFQRREFDVLVSTAVVEVGIDVPNATVMLIEGANRFGLAQLHQFRGRVGRGPAQSYCMLISDRPNPDSDERLRVVEKTHDGFQLAEADLRLRGPGEFFGTRQSGLPDLKMAKLGDTVVLEEARHAADELFRADPHLRAPEHRALRGQVEEFWQVQLVLN